MKKVELLAPAGSYEALQAAVQNGCDAVYLGGAMFGARAFASNFDEVEMKRAIAYAHVYGVRVFVTVNTLIYETEMETCLDYVKFLYENDVDALIIQDLGLFSAVHQMFPDLELHASTQMHIHNPQGISLLKNAGAKRVVVPRETSIEEIQEYSKLGVDLEVFVQGALCVSYSGQCLMSAITLQRSGNRGECAQSCRMQYELKKDEQGKVSYIPTKGNYLLSPKDLNSIANVSQLIEAGISSFKIEGRMKRPEYVALMVASYRKAIDSYYEGRAFKVDDILVEEMQKIFHRGFTAGHLFHKKGSQLMNFVRPNHIGIEIGEVTRITKDKMTIALVKDLAQGDGIRILKEREDEGFRVNRIYKNGLLVNKAQAFDIIELDKTSFVAVGSKILKTSDTKQLKTLQDTYQSLHRRVPLSGMFTMKLGSFAQLDVWDDAGYKVEVRSDSLVEQALKVALDQERIETQLRKTKDTPFMFAHIGFDIDAQGTFPIKELNQMRRIAMAEIEELRKHRYKNRRINNYDIAVSSNLKERNICVIIHRYEQYLACIDAGIADIYVDGRALYRKLKAEQACVKFRYPRVMKNVYEESNCMIQEAGGLHNTHQVMSDTSLNITNAYAAAFLFQQDVSCVTLSLEVDKSAYKKITEAFLQRYHHYGNFALQVYGREELMLSDYCVINACERDNDKKQCSLCRGNVQYSLVDMKKHVYPLLNDEDCRMHILNEVPRNQIHEITEALDSHIHTFLCVFTLENQLETKKILDSCLHKIGGE